MSTNKVYKWVKIRLVESLFYIMQKKRVLFLANHFITLHSFRKEMIQAMVDAGHDVYLSLPEDKDNE